MVNSTQCLLVECRAEPLLMRWASTDHFTLSTQHSKRESQMLWDHRVTTPKTKPYRWQTMSRKASQRREALGLSPEGRGLQAGRRKDQRAGEPDAFGSLRSLSRAGGVWAEMGKFEERQQGQAAEGFHLPGQELGLHLRSA